MDNGQWIMDNCGVGVADDWNVGAAIGRPWDGKPVPYGANELFNAE